jgi:hypothetical protein
MADNTQDLTDFKHSEHLISHKHIAPRLIDEVSKTEFYIGESDNTRLQDKDNWQIKRIWQVGSVWNIGFPEGNQDYIWNWDDRDTYTYHA